MTKANVPPNVTPNVSDIHTYTLRTLLRVYRRTDDGKNEPNNDSEEEPSQPNADYSLSGGHLCLFYEYNI